MATRKKLSQGRPVTTAELTGLEKIPLLIPGENLTVTVDDILDKTTKENVGLSNVDNTSDINKPLSTASQAALSGKANLSHTHAIENVTGLQTVLDGKASSDHQHTFGNVNGLQTALDNKTDIGHEHSIANVTGLQAVLDTKANDEDKANVIHTHDVTDVTGLQTSLNNKASQNDLTVGLAQKANTVHTHAISDVAGLQTALDAASGIPGLVNALTTKADINHTHTISDVTDLQTTLDDKLEASDITGKSDVGHGHTISAISGLQTVLDTKLEAVDIAGKADITHTHTQNDVAGLPAALLNKANTVHGHNISDVTGLQTALDAKADDTTLAGKADTVHTHAIANVTGLQAALDDKADINHTHPNNSALPTVLNEETIIYTGSEWIGSDIPTDFSLAVGDFSSELTLESKATFIATRAITIQDIVAELETPQTSGSIITFDIRKNGNSILNTLGTIDNTETSTLSAASSLELNPIELNVNIRDKITGVITQKGDNTARRLNIFIKSKLKKNTILNGVPASVNNLAFWLDTADTNYTNFSGQNFVSIVCKVSGSTYNQSDSNLRPNITLAEPSSGLILNSLQFGPNARKFITTPTPITLTIPFTIFIVYKVITSTGVSSYSAFSISNSNNTSLIESGIGAPYFMIYKSPGCNSGLWPEYYANGSNYVYSGSPNQITPNIGISESIITNSNLTTILKNNNQILNNTYAGGGLSQGLTLRHIGSPDNLYSNHINIGEIVAYNGIISNNDADIVRNYLSSKWLPA